MTTGTPPALGRYFGIDVPFMEHIGLAPLSLDTESCRTRLAWNPTLVNSRGDIHGGTLMSAFDFTLAAAARSHDPLRLGSVTVDLTTHFLDTARCELTVIGRCIKRGKSMAFCEGEIVKDDGTVVAVARGAFKLIMREGAGASPR